MDVDRNIREASEATVEFEQSLTKLVLESFAKGAKIERQWIVSVPESVVPSWTIDVRKRAVTDANYDPDCIDE